MSKADKEVLAAGAKEIRKAEKDKGTATSEKAVKINGLTVHPIACLFPILHAKEMKDLREDIAQRGIIVPILVNKKRDTILDGRNRYLAALDLGLKAAEIPTVTFKGKDEEIPAEIISRNIFRRHMNDEQRVQLVDKILGEQLEKEAAERKSKKGTFGGDGAASAAGSVASHLTKIAKVSAHKAERAVKIRKAGFADDVIAGKRKAKDVAKGLGTKKQKAPKVVPLEDRVWQAYEVLLKKFTLDEQRQVKTILRGFLIEDAAPAKK